jgi:hypothetical protein
MTHLSRLFLACLVFALTASPASAQYASEPKPWGIIATIAPWSADDTFKALYDADGLDMAGKDLRVGITRGGALGNEWALMFMRRTINEGSTLVNYKGETFRFQPGVKLTGFMAEQFGAFGTIAERVQIGGLIGGGLARAEGTAIALSTGTEVEAADVLTLFARPVSFQLLLRAELAVGIKLAPGTKIRFSGGFNWPGTTIFSVTGMYFFGDK